MLFGNFFGFNADDEERILVADKRKQRAVTCIQRNKKLKCTGGTSNLLPTPAVAIKDSFVKAMPLPRTSERHKKLTKLKLFVILFARTNNLLTPLMMKASDTC